MNLKESRLSTEQLVDGILLKAYRDRVMLPNGDTSVREWIDHPGASAVIPLFDNGDTLLIRQYRYPPQKIFIEVPAGKLDGGDAEEVAFRELEEETGYRASRMTCIGGFYPCIGYSNEKIYLYVAEGLTDGISNLDDEEFVEPFRIPFDQAIQMVTRGEIEDMKSMLAILLAREFIARRSGGDRALPGNRDRKT